MSPQQIIKKYIAELQAIYGEREAKNLAVIGLEHICDKNYAWLLAETESLAPNEIEELLIILEKLKKEIPIQHITNKAYFLDLELFVDKNVLIPRPETEELVMWIVEKRKTYLPPNPSPKILDIGTGSGCIALSLKQLMPDKEVFALDVSEQALAITKKNALANNLAINYLQLDILNESSWQQLEKFDVIVSNPPYITQAEKTKMHPNVLNNEPALALFVTDEQPLLFYEKICDFALQNLYPNGFLFFEINEYFGKETLALMEQKGFVNCELKQDISGKDRMVFGALIPEFLLGEKL